MSAKFVTKFRAVKDGSVQRSVHAAAGPVGGAAPPTAAKSSPAVSGGAERPARRDNGHTADALLPGTVERLVNLRLNHTLIFCK